MRTRDEILSQARDDITSKNHKPDIPFWLEYRKIEVLIDIRDIHSRMLDTFNRIFGYMQTHD